MTAAKLFDKLSSQEYAEKTEPVSNMKNLAVLLAYFITCIDFSPSLLQETSMLFDCVLSHHSIFFFEDDSTLNLIYEGQQHCNSFVAKLVGNEKESIAKGIEGRLVSLIM